MNQNLLPCYKQLYTILKRYETYIVDLWGVIYDDKGLLPLATTLISLAQHLGGNLIFISNSSERSLIIHERLKKLKLKLPDCTTVITAGELLYRDLYKKPKFRNKSFFLIQNENDLTFFQNLPISFTKGVDDADFILAHSISPDPMGVNQYLPILETGLKNNIPLIIGNCDMGVPSHKSIIARPGLLASFYAEHKGKILFYGKPYSPIYTFAHRKIESTICIGDSIYTDIVGGNLKGYDTLLLKSKRSLPEFANNYTITLGLSSSIRSQLSTLITPTYCLEY